MFSLLVGEVTAKATRSLQISPGFGEFFINVSKAHSGHPGWSCGTKETGGPDHFGERQLWPRVVSSCTKSNEHHMHRGEPLFPHGQDSPKHSANPTLHVVERQKQNSTSMSQENLLAIETFLGGQGQSCLLPPAPRSTTCLSTYSPRDGTLDLAFHRDTAPRGLWCLFSFQTITF